MWAATPVCDVKKWEAARWQSEGVERCPVNWGYERWDGVVCVDGRVGQHRRWADEGRRRQRTNEERARATVGSMGEADR
jgi:hypothetical protein